MELTFPTKKILIVDDNQIIRCALSSALKAKGYKVFTAVDGPEAFIVVGREEPDLILLDIFFPPDVFQMGNAWDAFLIMNWLRRMSGLQASHTPVFIISGADPEEYRDRCLAAGAANYFQKPIKIPELLYAIEQIFHPSESDVPLELVAQSNSDYPRL
jgi:CheY-like chemotaxis protein